MRTLVLVTALLALVIPTTGCVSSSIGNAAQDYLEPYVFNVQGQIDGQVAFNSKYLAVNAQVNVLVQFSGPNGILWERNFDKESGQRAYRVVFDDERFVAIEPVPWEEAIASLRPQTIPD